MRPVAYAIATWCGCGKVPIAPGTMGTLGAIPLYLVVRPSGTLAVLGAAAIVAIIGIWAAGRVAEDIGEKDPPIVVVDEVAGMLVTLAASPHTSKGLVVAFVLFRIFDQIKPWPARALEDLRGGFGIVLDDVAAGAWGAIVLLVLRDGGVV